MLPFKPLETFVWLTGARIVRVVKFPFRAKKHFKYMWRSSPIASRPVSQPPTLSASVRGSEYTEVGGPMVED